MAVSRDEVFEKIKEELIDALGVDDDEIETTSTLMGDLGAESIDFLDIIFRLEKAFDIKIPREEIFPDESLLSDPEVVSDSKLTDKGLAMLKERMPHLELGDFEQDPDINKVGDLITVDAIVNYVERRVNG